jgi:hypothetical protein
VSDVFTKTFVVRGEGHRNPEHPIHYANAVEVAHEALAQGWHPKDTCTLVSAEVVSHSRRGEANVELTYEVAVVRAEDDTDAPSTVSPGQVAEPAAADSAPKKAKGE